MKCNIASGSSLFAKAPVYSYPWRKGLNHLTASQDVARSAVTQR